MPLFLAPILWATSAGAVAAGAAMGCRAEALWAEAARIRDGADADFARAQEELRAQMDATNGSLDCLNRLRTEVAAGELERGLRAFAAVRDVKRGAGPPLAGSVTAPEFPMEAMQRTASTAVDLMKVGSLAVAGGAAGVAGALGLATTVGMASTGTAIATLSGAAAKSATLAWLGGGALSAGGAGMTGGMAALGGVFAGPAIAVAGAAAWAAAEKDGTNAEEHAKAVAQSVAATLMTVERLRIIDARVTEIAASLTAMAAAVDRLAEQMAVHLAAHGWQGGAGPRVPYDDLTPEARTHLILLGGALKALHGLLNIDVVADAQNFARSGGESETAGARPWEQS